MLHRLRQALVLVTVLSASLAAPVAGQSLNRLLDIVPGGQSSYPYGFTDLFDTTVFVARPGAGLELWRTDGTSAGTARLLAFNRPGYARIQRIGDSALIVMAGGGYSGELWESDGTASGTRRLQAMNFAGTYLAASVAVGERMFFVEEAGPGSHVLWVTDGSAAGTRRLAGFQRLDELLPFDDEILFRARTAAEGYELWRSDGTAAGTRIVRDVNPGAAGSIDQVPIRFRDAVYFIKATAGAAEGLWTSDGTSAGTRELARFSSLTNSMSIAGAATDYVYVGVNQGGSYYELHAVDRRSGATTLVGVAGWMYGGVEFDGRLLLRVNQIGAAGLWFADAAAGTLVPGPMVGWGGNDDETLVAGSRRSFLTVGGNVFAAGVGVPTGTMNRGLYLAGGLAISGRHLYCSAREGNELWEPYVATIDAHSIPLGTGLGHGLRVPELRTDDPVLGRPMSVDLRDAPPGAQLALLVGFGAPRPLRFARDAFSYVDPASTTSVIGQAAAGGWTTTFQVPNDPSLADLPVVLQAVLTGTPSPRGFELTNAVSTRVGS